MLPERRPPARAQSSKPSVLDEYLDHERGAGLSPGWLGRYFALRKRGLLMPLLNPSDVRDGWFVATDAFHIWLNPEFVTTCELKARVERVEQEALNEARKTDAA